MLPIFSIFPIPTKGCLPFRNIFLIIIIIVIIINNNIINIIIIIIINNIIIIIINNNIINIIINNNLAILPKNIMSKALENWGLKGSSFIFGCQNAGRGSGGGAGWDTSTLFQPFCWIPVTSKLDTSVLRWQGPARSKEADFREGNGHGSLNRNPYCWVYNTLYRWGWLCLSLTFPLP